MSESTKKLWRKVFAVIAGVLVAIIIIVPLGLVGALMLFSDDRIPQSQAVTGYVIMTAAVILGSFAAGYTTRKRSENPYSFLVTAIILFLLVLVLVRFDLSELTLFELVSIGLLV